MHRLEPSSPTRTGARVECGPQQLYCGSVQLVDASVFSAKWLQGLLRVYSNGCCTFTKDFKGKEERISLSREQCLQSLPREHPEAEHKMMKGKTPEGHASMMIRFVKCRNRSLAQSLSPPDLRPTLQTHPKHADCAYQSVVRMTHVVFL